MKKQYIDNLIITHTLHGIIEKQLQDYYHQGLSLEITSLYRNPERNKAANGSPKSQHLQSKAMDLIGWENGNTIPPETIASYLEQLIYHGIIPQGGIGIYNTHTHYDWRGTEARWDKTAP